MNQIHDIAYITGRRFNPQLNAYEYECNIGAIQPVYYTTNTIANSGLENWLCVLDYERESDLNNEYTQYILMGGQGNNLPHLTQINVVQPITQPVIQPATQPVVKQEHDTTGHTSVAQTTAVNGTTARNGTDSATTHQTHAYHTSSNTLYNNLPLNHNNNTHIPDMLAQPLNLEPITSTIEIKREPSLPQLERVDDNYTSNDHHTHTHDNNDTAVQQDVVIIAEHINKRHKPNTYVKPEPNRHAEPHTIIDEPPQLRPVSRNKVLNTSFDILPTRTTTTNDITHTISTPIKILLELKFFKLDTDNHNRQCYRCKCNISWLTNTNTDRLIEHLQNDHLSDYQIYCETQALQQSYLRHANGKSTHTHVKPRIKPTTKRLHIQSSNTVQPTVNGNNTHKTTSSSSTTANHHTTHSITNNNNTHRPQSMIQKSDIALVSTQYINRSASPTSSTASVSPIPTQSTTTVDYTKPPDSLLFVWGFFQCDVADDNSVEWVCQIQPRCFNGSRISFKPHNGISQLVDHLQNQHLEDYGVYIATEEGKDGLTSKVGKRHRHRK